MGFSVFFIVSSSDSGVVEGTIATLTTLDAFVTSTIICLRADGREKVGGYHQKLYSATFSEFHLIAFAQLNQQIGTYVEHWCSEKLTVTSLSIHAPQNPSDLMSVPMQTYDGSIYSISQQASSCSVVLVASEWYYLLHVHYS